MTKFKTHKNFITNMLFWKTKSPHLFKHILIFITLKICILISYTSDWKLTWNKIISLQKVWHKQCFNRHNKIKTGKAESNTMYLYNCDKRNIVIFSIQFILTMSELQSLLIKLMTILNFIMYYPTDVILSYKLFETHKV